MAKASVGGGPSYTEHEQSDPHPPVRITRPHIGDVDKWGGNTSEVSTEAKQSDSNNSERSRPEPAQMTENPSAQPSTGSFDAHSTDGSTPQMVKGSARKAAAAQKRPVRRSPKATASQEVVELPESDDDFDF